jgi:hypothetical protein
MKMAFVWDVVATDLVFAWCSALALDTEKLAAIEL